MSLLDVVKSLSGDGIPYAKISLWIIRSSSDGASRIYEGFEKGYFLEKQQLEPIFLPLCFEIASFDVSNCIAVVMNEREMWGKENYEKIESRLIEEIQKLGEYYSKKKDIHSARFCNEFLVDPSIRGRARAYFENDQAKLAVCDDDINRYADKYRPQIRNLPESQAKTASFLVRLLRVAQVERIPYEAGQKLAEMLITDTVFDDVKGVTALGEAVTNLLRGKL